VRAGVDFRGTSYILYSSPLNSVTLPDSAKVRAAIPPSAKFYAFCHPVCVQRAAADGNYAPLDAVEMVKIKEYNHAESAFKALEGSSINRKDPFVAWLCTGGFVYFDYKFDIVAINALYFEQLADSTTALYYGEASVFPQMAIEPLWDMGRWWPVTALHIRKLGVTQRESNSHSSDHSRLAHRPHADRKIDSSTLAGSIRTLHGSRRASLRAITSSPSPEALAICIRTTARFATVTATGSRTSK